MEQPALCWCTTSRGERHSTIWRHGWRMLDSIQTRIWSSCWLATKGNPYALAYAIPRAKDGHSTSNRKHLTWHVNDHAQTADRSSFRLIDFSFQWFRLTSWGEERGRWSVRPRTWASLYGDIGTNCGQRRRGVHKYGKRNLRENSRGRFRHKQWGEYDRCHLIREIHYSVAFQSYLSLNTGQWNQDRSTAFTNKSIVTGRRQPGQPRQWRLLLSIHSLETHRSSDSILYD